MVEFDHYFSLGVNCEGAFQIRRILGRDSSCFFSWNVTRFSSLQSILKNRFQGVCQLENVSLRQDTGLIHDSSFDFQFHSPFSPEQQWSGPEFEAKFKRLQEKMVYLIEKFHRVAASGESVAYFYRTEETDGVREKACELVNILMGYHKYENFRLVVLQTKDKQQPDWNEPLISNRYLARFAPWSDATDGHVRSWDQIFTEFPHARSELRLARFDKVSNPMEEEI